MGTREHIREYLKQHLVGPRKGPEEEIEGRVHLNYMMGILYAQGTGSYDLDIDEAMPEGEQTDVNSGGEEQADVDFSGLADAFSLLPSSAGFSFCAKPGTKIRVTARAGRYKPITGEGVGRYWKRRQLEQKLTFEIQPGDHAKVPAFEGLASVRLLSRVLADGSCIATLTLVNEQQSGQRSDASSDLFQVELTCDATETEFNPYPASRLVSDIDVEVERALRITGLEPFAIGHGASVTWNARASRPNSIALDFLPMEYVGRPIFDNIRIGDEEFEGPEIFNLAYLSDTSLDTEELCSKLFGLADFYSEWKNQLNPNIYDDNPRKNMANRRVEDIEDAVERIKAGIDLIRGREDVRDAFQLANLAMLIQMVHAEKLKLSGAPLELGKAQFEDIDYLQETRFAWRPFQLAFMLLVLESLVNTDSDYRETVDLIWFSTGGGKTEAYLFVAAFELLFRRIKYGERGGGTAVINRYTYRFLTADQFERTTRLACAMERVRCSREECLGYEPFTVGLWVGEKVTPLYFSKAVEKLDELRDSLGTNDISNEFQVEMCPDCGTRLFPLSRMVDDHGEEDWSHYGFVATAGSFHCRCPDPSCWFHDELPFSMVDDALYQKPPSFLIGTIDKFAMMAWKEQSGAFLGAGGSYEPPSLIIQDELHLISGPLGTLAGIYEAAFESVIKHHSGGVSPKYVASTATISNAHEQCTRLYAKGARIFPSPGLSSSDSFFSRIDEDPKRSRLYVGVMGQGIKNTVAVYWTIAAILQAVSETEMSNEELDSYWSLLAYHNSKRELGRTRNAVSDEISSRIMVYSEIESRRRKLGEPLEISSNAVSSVSSARADLSRKHEPDSPAVDVVPCTNMISVGIDIDRLGIMFVNGQPKLTSEYIQATSRVGRRAIPGLVVTCFSPTKPRDRSHYESFRHFHSIMNAFVEPTSVTPGARPALERALHAALVISTRFAGDAPSNGDAVNFNNNDPTFITINENLRQRLLNAYSENRMERATIMEVFETRVQEWERWLGRPNLVYQANDNNSTGLLREFTDKSDRPGWRTLRSMRHVDVDVDMRVE